MKAPLRAPRFEDLVAALPHQRFVAIAARGTKPTVDGRYRHWDALRHLTPPADLTPEEWWFALKLARRQAAQELPVRDGRGQPFTFTATAPAQRLLRRIDRDASGQIAISEQVTNADTRNRYLVSSLIEEAITSSQLEGASTSRLVAKQMLRSGRPPTDRSEQMIVNNYRAMGFVRDHADEELTPDLVCELHRIVTVDTLEDPRAAGRLQRTDEDRVSIVDELGRLLHAPPPAEQLPERLEAMCGFANGDTRTGADEFLHPVVEAVVLHFWLAHDHPFVDGNGRTARALFYWAMLRRGYWLTEFLTISSILERGPAKYGRAFLYSEEDENDLTYFVLFHLDVIVRAIENLKAYLERKVAEVRETEGLLREVSLNHRQRALLGHALRHPGASYTYRSHATSHDVVYQSARNDLLDLEDRGLVTKHKVGRKHVFRAVPDLASRLTGSQGA